MTDQALAADAARRRTFAIISHPDAGKTTLTEKLLLFGGAIQLAGAVKAKGERRRARSDWMKVEQERGISVATSVMTFEYGDNTFNLLDTPGHEDFSEDTYRTLTAVDSAVMVLDAARGIQNQTLKLFEVCRMRNIPIITLINKMDRDGRDSFELLDEIEQTLQLEVSPAVWPVGMGRDFLGCYDLLRDRLALLKKSKGGLPDEGVTCQGLGDPAVDAALPAHAAQKLREEVAMARGLCPALSLDDYRAGVQTPVFFSSAVNNFGVRELLDGLAAFAPPPGDRAVDEGAAGEGGAVSPADARVTGFVFKIQANMDPKHRDRIAFFRVCSGRFKKGMKLNHARTEKALTIAAPVLFLARERASAEEAAPGDIIGIPNHGQLRIGDSLSSGAPVRFGGVPNFAPELMRRARPEDPMRAKHLGRALTQLAEEGAASVFKPVLGADWIVGVVGPLQFDVLADRIRSEYDVPVRFEETALHAARWVRAPDARTMKEFEDTNRTEIAHDHDGGTVFLARNAWRLDRAMEDWPKIAFEKVREALV
ncbi:MAG: peptide chain release factor 3 [Rhodospirillales bacterium]